MLPRILVAALALILPLAAQDPEIHKVSEAGLTPPRILHKVQPKYSKKARKNKIEGAVTLSIIVDADGKPRDISVKKSLDPDLDQNAIAAVQDWIFKPATKKNGEPVAVYATVEVTFHLLDP
jgi:protein TonB